MMNEKKVDSSELCGFRNRFNKKLLKYYENEYESIKKLWSRQRIAEVIRHINIAKMALRSGVPRTSSEYYWSSKYDTIQVNRIDSLILKKSSPKDPTIIVVAVEDYFNLLLDIHDKCGHNTRDKMRSIIKDQYYIQVEAVTIFVSLCPTCNKKGIMPKKVMEYKQFAPKLFNRRVSVDIIDIQSTTIQDKLHAVEKIAVDIDEHERIADMFDESNCPVCREIVRDGHICMSCLEPIHSKCGIPNKSYGYSSQLRCLICTTKNPAKKKRSEIGHVKHSLDKAMEERRNKRPRLDIESSMIHYVNITSSSSQSSVESNT